jgi:mevalonate kinase
MSTIVSAPAKIHLLGEHTVVYGKPAILSAINKRLYVEVKTQNFPPKADQPMAEKLKTQNSGEIKIKSEEKSDLIWETINIFKKFNHMEKLPSLNITITSQIPLGSGMGSSVALSSALIGALSKHVRNIWNPVKINELSYEAEKIAHGNPSGADNTTVVFGGLVWFRKEFDFLKSIWSLPLNSYKIPEFVLIDSGRPVESTREMVERVEQLFDKDRDTMETLFNNQEALTRSLLLSLRSGDIKEMMTAISNGEKNLEKMGVVGDFASGIIRDIGKTGGVAKICGAGGRKRGSGIILAYHKELDKLKMISDKYGVLMSPVKLGEEGIRIENKTNNPINK